MLVLLLLFCLLFLTKLISKCTHNNIYTLHCIFFRLLCNNNNTNKYKILMGVKMVIAAHPLWCVKEGIRAGDMTGSQEKTRRDSWQGLLGVNGWTQNGTRTQKSFGVKRKLNCCLKPLQSHLQPFVRQEIMAVSFCHVGERMHWICTVLIPHP